MSSSSTNNIKNKYHLILPGNIRLDCTGFGYTPPNTVITGELVFQTGMVGYPEVITDPSYENQLVVMTYPHVGNYSWPEPTYKHGDSLSGINTSQESSRPYLKCLIVAEYTDPTDRLAQILADNKILGLYGIDTRYLTEYIREHGDCIASVCNADSRILSIPTYQPESSQASRPEIKHMVLDSSHPRVLVWDFGIKHGQLDCLLTRGLQLDIYPHDRIPEYANESIHEITREYSGIFLSNGPGDPRTRTQVIAFLTKLIEAKVQIPIFGICLGHQVLALAAGLQVQKLKYGHRGQNVPCRFVREISSNEWQPSNIGILTSQNHGYEVILPDATPGNRCPACDIDPDDYKGPNCDDCAGTGFMCCRNGQCKIPQMPKCANGGFRPLFLNANDGSNEGIVHDSMDWFSVQFHPEARPGPRDSEFLFDIFAERVQLRNNTQPPDAEYLDNYVLPIHLEIGSRLVCIERTYGAYDRWDLGGSQTPLRQPTVYDDKTTELPVSKGKVLIIGSGGLQIAQAGEFDYSGSQAIKSFQAAGLETILINPNIATIQTSMADRTYYVPLDTNFITQVIQTEKPEYITVSFGGQTALNCGMELWRTGVLAKHGVKLLGTALDNVHVSEDRQLFKQTIEQLTRRDGAKVACPPSISCATVQEALAAAQVIGYPLLVRAGFCLGGAGSGFVNSDSELVTIAEQAFIAAGSQTASILLDKSLRGWKELELEIMRDMYGNKLCICAMENVDPLGVHTGESIVVAPCQTITDNEFQTMRDIAFQIADQIGIVGECNVQFTINPRPANPSHPDIYVIEMNARLSRSSALASKATGYPIAAIAAKLQLGYSLLELKNESTGNSAFFEPALDYVVVKIPRWDLDKTPGVSPVLGSAMKSIGEVMGIGRNFREALMKAVRMVGLPEVTYGFLSSYPTVELDSLRDAVPDRIVKLMVGLFQSLGIADISRVTGITEWFLYQLDQIITVYKTLNQATTASVCNTSDSNNQVLFAKQQLDAGLLLNAKISGLSDSQIASAFRVSPIDISQMRAKYEIHATARHIDTVAGEFPCRTNYMYMSYEPRFLDDKQNDNNYIAVSRSSPSKHAANTQVTTAAVVVLGSGVYRIGSSVEFDWCAVETCREIRKMGYRAIMINHNPETVSTDFDEADILYFDELTAEIIQEIYQAVPGQCMGVIVSMGGQTANNLVMHLAETVNILGTSAEMIDTAENRYKFSRLCDSIGIDQPKWAHVSTHEAAMDFIKSAGGYPVLVRPSYVLSGAGMTVVNSDSEYIAAIETAHGINKLHPLVISKFINDAKEIEVDAVAQNGQIIIMAISEHVENAGVHSGDATLVLPAQDLTPVTINAIKHIAHSIAGSLAVTGPFNLQLIAKDDKLQVIECNLRASRSFPFASRTLDINFIKLATQIILNPACNVSALIPESIILERVGVKVPMFSYSRLPGAHITLGVEMKSTGEVACFGANRNIAYLKALMATGMKMPPVINSHVLLLTSGGDASCPAIMGSLMGYMKDMHWTIDTGPVTDSIIHKVQNKTYNLIILLSANEITNQEQLTIARLAIDTRTPLCINNKQAKLLIESLYYYYNHSLRIDTFFDSQPHISCSGDITSQRLSPAVIANSLQCVAYQPSSSPNNPISTIQQPTQIIFSDKHILTATQFNRNLLRQIFKRASEWRSAFSNNQLKNNIIGGGGGNTRPLSGKVIGLLFYTPSTRTRCSFESAIKYLGGETILVNAAEASVQKGESLADTIRALNCYTDGLVIRSPNNVNLMDYRFMSRHSIINAGDMDEHPTQSLLDLFTIREERGSVNKVRIAFVGDLLNGRTVHSLVKMLCCYDVEMYFVSSPRFSVPDYLIKYLQEQHATSGNKISWQSIHSMKEWLDIIPTVEVIYMTRMQSERIETDSRDGEHGFALTREILDMCRSDAIILHPLPRNQEIPESLDSDIRCKYFKQMEYGLFIRMALVELIFSRGLAI